MSTNVWLGHVSYSNILNVMDNKKTLKPGQLATVKIGEIFGEQGKISEERVIVRASKKVTNSCFSCYIKNSYLPCHCFISLKKCKEMFGLDSFPIVVYEKTVFNT